MRHIPEEELHAYLDQGLSRTQCVEIESHLAACPSCQANRDSIAALRDRTTALLSRLAPPRSFPPGFEVLRRRAAERASERRRRAYIATWAASLVAAVGLGWGASFLMRPGISAPARQEAAVPTPSARRAVASQTPARTVAAPAVRAPVRRDSSALPRRSRAAATLRSREAAADSARAATLAVLNLAPALELSSLDSSDSVPNPQFDGMWRTISWDGAQAEAGQKLPHIDGLPVVQVQVQAGEQGKRPVMVVAQQLSSGQVIRTIEGPASDVSHLLARRSMSDPDSLGLRGDSLLQSGGDQAMAMQVGDRMLAITGALPSDSLRAMIRRLNAEMRSK